MILNLFLLRFRIYVYIVMKALVHRTSMVENSGFSLTELLVVIGIVTLLALISIPSIGALSSANRVGQTISTIAGVLEQAREYAVAQNTHVWVGFNVDNTQNTITMVVVASKDGTNLAEALPVNLGLAPSSTLDLVYRPQTFKQMALKEAGDGTVQSYFTTPLLPTSDSSNALCSGVSVSVKIPGYTAATAFTRLLQFTPSGGVRNGTGTINLVEFGLQPRPTAQASNNSAGAANVCVVRVNGVTGQTRVYRP